jgi:hypothetical protein
MKSSAHNTKMKSIILIYTSILLFPICSLSQITSTFDKWSISLDEKGRISSLSDRLNNRELIDKSQPAPFVRLKIGSSIHFPDKLSYQPTSGTIDLFYNEESINVKIEVRKKHRHLSFEVIDIKPIDKIDVLIWGPFPTKINEIVGEIIGVVRDQNFALGIQALNVETIGGYPLNEDGYDGSRGHAAEKKEWGSVLQAYSINRSKLRTIDVWDGQFPNMPVPPMKTSTVIGSKIALFGCDEKEVLNTIGEIEVSEGLPHPMIDGVWAKVSPERGRSYLIADYSENDIDELLGYTKRANLMTLYHMEPFESWGHYRVSRKSFPNGINGLKKCVEKAKAVGIRLGAHTLTNFIQTHDAYVTPIPDKRLAATGSSSLTEDINDTIRAIKVASPYYFANEKANWLHTVMIDEELIRYNGVTADAPYKLLDCERGAFGTRKSGHAKNGTVKKLLDHPYEVFFPTIDMQREIAGNMAEFFNESGVSQMDFDGHEGCAASGEGDYAIELFAKDFYDKVDHTVINGTSNSKHFYWHINTYCNWGEPWYEGFRESMQEYRIKNQELFDRNYLPNMLGWYLLMPTTSLSDIEWMLARGSGYNAGFALATNLEALRVNPQTGEILDAIREWETVRRLGVFNQEQRERMKDPKFEFHLLKVDDSTWDLFPYHKSREFRWEISHDTTLMMEFINPDKEQPVQFILRILGDSGSVINPEFRINKTTSVAFLMELKVNETLLCEGIPAARVYDRKGVQIENIRCSRDIPNIESGKHQIEFSCIFSGGLPASVIVQFKTIGTPERIGK